MIHTGWLDETYWMAGWQTYGMIRMENILDGRLNKGWLIIYSDETNLWIEVWGVMKKMGAVPWPWTSTTLPRIRSERNLSDSSQNGCGAPPPLLALSGASIPTSLIFISMSWPTALKESPSYTRTTLNVPGKEVDAKGHRRKITGKSIRKWFFNALSPS